MSFIFFLFPFLIFPLFLLLLFFFFCFFPTFPYFFFFSPASYLCLLSIFLEEVFFFCTNLYGLSFNTACTQHCCVYSSLIYTNQYSEWYCILPAVVKNTSPNIFWESCNRCSCCNIDAGTFTGSWCIQESKGISPSLCSEIYKTSIALVLLVCKLCYSQTTKSLQKTILHDSSRVTMLFLKHVALEMVDTGLQVLQAPSKLSLKAYTSNLPLAKC